MKKRIGSILMAVCMIMTLLPLTAMAAEDGVTMYINSNASYENGTPPDRAEGARYKNLADAAKAVVTSKDIVVIEDMEWTFTTDFTLEKPTAKFKLRVAENQTLTVDIQGCTVDLSNVALQNYGTLTVTDSTTSGSGVLKSTATPLIENYGSATVSGNITVETTDSMAVKGTKSTSTFVLEGGVLTGKSYGYFGTAATCQLKHGIINGGVSPSSGTLTIGTQGSDNQSLVINGSLKMSDSVTVHCGDIKDLTGTIGADVQFNGILRTDVSSKLPAGKKCTVGGTDGKGTYYTIEDMQEGDAAAQVGDDLYASLATAAKAVKNNETLTLLKDYTGSSTITINAYGVTVELNGHSITNTSSDEDAVGLEVYPKYNVKPTDGNMTTLIKNSSDTQAAITASIPLSIGTGNSQNIISALMEGDIALNPAGEQSIELGNARLLYSEDAAKTVGGYRATAEDGNSYIYGTAAAAIKASTDHTATLLNDYTGDGGLALATEGATGIIDLDGHTFTTSALDAIAANAKGVNLTIKNGVVISTSKGSDENWPAGAAINFADDENYYDNASITLENVQLTVQNPGYGVVVSGNNTDNSIIIKNSTITVPSTGVGIYFPPKSGTLTIENSNVTGGTAVIVKGGTANIGEGSVIHATGAKVVPTEPVGSGANDTGDAVYLEGNYDRATTINIEGGYFTSDNGYAVQMLFENDEIGEKAINISGGYFTSDPSKYCVEGMTGVTSDVSGYAFMVGKADEGEILEKPATADPVVDMTGSSIPEGSKGTVEEAAKTVEADDAIAEEARTAEVSESQKEDAIEKATEENIISSDNESDLIIYKQTYLAVKPTQYTTEGETTTLTMEITPMLQLVASTAADADEIKLEGDGGNKNAVKVGEAQELTINTPSEITVTLPEAFKDKLVYILHRGTYYYQAQADENGQITFTSRHGFSPFEFSTANGAAAEITEDGQTVGYSTLQQAVNAVDENGTITLLKDGLEASTNKTIKVQNTGSNPITVKINGTDYTIAAGDTETITYTAPSHDSDSGSTVTRYAVTVEDVRNGEVRVSPTRAAYNQTVTITVSPDKGYELSGLTVTDRDGDELDLTAKGNGRYTFKMPRSAVTVEAVFARIESALTFTDVPMTEWYYNAVVYAVDNGIMGGFNAQTFGPEETLPRSQMVQVLYNLSGQPDLTGLNLGYPYSDVPGDQWYANAVYWARLSGIAGGYNDNTFRPDRPVTRQEAAVMMRSYALLMGCDVSYDGQPVLAFADSGEVDSWAWDAMSWAVDAGVMGGKGGVLDPTGIATRAEIAQMLMSLCENVLNG